MALLFDMFDASLATDLAQENIEFNGSQPPFERFRSSKTSIVFLMHTRVVIPSYHI